MRRARWKICAVLRAKCPRDRSSIEHRDWVGSCLAELPCPSNVGPEPPEFRRGLGDSFYPSDEMLRVLRLPCRVDVVVRCYERKGVGIPACLNRRVVLPPVGGVSKVNKEVRTQQR